MITAPIAGEILQTKVRAGEYIIPGAPTPSPSWATPRGFRSGWMSTNETSRKSLCAKAFVTLDAYPDRRVPATVVEVGRRMGRKNVRTDDPTERIDTKILEVVLELADKTSLVPEVRVVAWVTPQGS
jgi:HlyD family secretion protein